MFFNQIYSILARYINGIAILVVVFFLNIFNAHANPLPVVPDGGTQTTVTTAPSGQVTVQIAPVPTHVTGDISHNTYTHFNVPNAGLNLDNRTAEARMIVNEVTSTNPSTIQGTLQVLGNQAHVIIANPNGITVNGGKFLNTGGLVLSTSRIGYVDRAVTPITTQRNPTFATKEGTITIGELGISGLFTNLEFIAKKVAVNGPITNDHPEAGSRTRFTLGEQIVELNSNISVVDVEHEWLGDSGSKFTAPPVADPSGFLLDFGTLGSVKSSRVAIAVTEKGAGVRIAGQVAATDQDFVITTEGRVELVNANITSNTHTTITTPDTVLLKGTSLKTGSVHNDGTVNTFGAFAFDSGNLELVHSLTNGKVTPTTIQATSGGTFTVANHTLLHASQVQALGHVLVHTGTFTSEGERIGNNWHGSSLTSLFGGTLIATHTGAITNIGSTLQGHATITDDPLSQGGLTLRSATTVDNYSVAKDALATLFSSQDDTVIDAPQDITNNTGQVLSNGKVRVISPNGHYRNIADKDIIPNEGVQEHYAYEGDSFLFRSTKVEGWRIAFGDPRIAGEAAVTSGNAGVEINAKKLDNYGGTLHSNEGKITLDVQEVRNEALLAGHAYLETRCRWICGTRGMSSIEQTGGIISGKEDVIFNTPGTILSRGGAIISATGNVVFNTPNPVRVESLPMIEAFNVDRGLTTFVHGGDYLTRILTFDQGGAIKANMGYIKLTSNVPLILDGGTIESTAEDIPGGVQIVREPQTKPLPVTGKHVGFFDGLFNL